MEDEASDSEGESVMSVSSHAGKVTKRPALRFTEEECRAIHQKQIHGKGEVDLVCGCPANDCRRSGHKNMEKGPIGVYNCVGTGNNVDGIRATWESQADHDRSTTAARAGRQALLESVAAAHPGLEEDIQVTTVDEDRKPDSVASRLKRTVTPKVSFPRDPERKPPAVKSTPTKEVGDRPFFQLQTLLNPPLIRPGPPAGYPSLLRLLSGHLDTHLEVVHCR
jgi:hypothetical protein